MALSNAFYGLYWIPKTAWHPFGSRSFKELGVIVQLGLAGVCQTASEWWSWELIGRKSNIVVQVHQFLLSDMAHFCAVAASL